MGKMKRKLDSYIDQLSQTGLSVDESMLEIYNPKPSTPEEYEKFAAELMNAAECLSEDTGKPVRECLELIVAMRKAVNSNDDIITTMG